MDVKVITEGGILPFFLVIGGAIVSWFSFWIKEFLSRRDAYRKFKDNPFAKVGANLHEWRDVGNQQVIGACRVANIEVGRVVLETLDASLVLTIQEFQAGHALWAEGE